MHAAVDSGCNENVCQMCELPNYGRVLVATGVMALWLRSGDGRALITLALLAMERRTVLSDRPGVTKNNVESKAMRTFLSSSLDLSRSSALPTWDRQRSCLGFVAVRFAGFPCPAATPIAGGGFFCS